MALVGYLYDDDEHSSTVLKKPQVPFFVARIDLVWPYNCQNIPPILVTAMHIPME